MSGYQYEQREERHEGRHSRREREREGRRDNYDNYGSEHQRGHHHNREEGYGYGDDQRRPQSYDSQGPGSLTGEGRTSGSYGYASPSGPPPSSGREPAGFASQGGLDRGDFASDADINRMIASGELGGQGGRPSQGYGYGGREGGGGERERFNTPSGPQRGQGFGDHTNDYGPPSGPPSGRGYQDQEQGYGSGGDRGGYGGDEQYGSQKTQGRSRYDSPQGPPPSSGYGRQQQGSTPSGGFSASRDGDDRYGSGYGSNDRNDSARRGGDNQYRSQQIQGESRYDSLQGPPLGSGYGRQQGSAPSGGFSASRDEDDQYESGYGSNDRSDSARRGGDNQYRSQQTRGESRYDSPQGPPLSSGYGRQQGNAPSGGFGSSRDGDDRYGSGYGSNDRSDSARRGGGDNYRNQQGSGGRDDRYSHLADIANEHGDDPELYRQATQGLHDKIQSQVQSRTSGRSDGDDDYRSHVDAHRKAYGGDDHGPMDADAIGAAAAVEAFKQSASANSSNAPAGAFKTGGGAPSKSGSTTQDGDDDGATAGRASASGGGGLQDKLVALAMSQAGKLFDKKNAGSSGSAASSGNPSQDKAQAMQSAAATAMQLYSKYQGGKLDSSDMSSVMTLAMKML